MKTTKHFGVLTHNVMCTKHFTLTECLEDKLIADLKAEKKGKIMGAVISTGFAEKQHVG